MQKIKSESFCACRAYVKAADSMCSMRGFIIDYCMIDYPHYERKYIILWIPSNHATKHLKRKL
jgi:hypothetical protein